MERIKRFLKDEEGVTAIEYGLIAALIAVAIEEDVIPIGCSMSTFSAETAQRLRRSDRGTC
jgi:pilus assembly protein Flp/PilA